MTEPEILESGQNKTMISLVNYIAESKALHQNVNIAEKLIVNKNYKSVPSKDSLADNQWRELTINMVDSRYADIDTDLKKFKKRLYNKDGTPTNWFAWWMMLCIYGPMNRKELLRYCGLPEGSYSVTWVTMSRDNMIKYNSKTRKSEPIPMSQWNKRCFK